MPGRAAPGLDLEWEEVGQGKGHGGGGKAEDDEEGNGPHLDRGAVVGCGGEVDEGVGMSHLGVRDDIEGLAKTWPSLCAFMCKQRPRTRDVYIARAATPPR